MLYQVTSFPDSDQTIVAARNNELVIGASCQASVAEVVASNNITQF